MRSNPCLNMSTEQAQNPYTSLCVQRSVKSRLESLKPFDSLSWNDFLDELADVYEENQT